MVSELIGVHQELGQALSDQAAARIAGFVNSHAETVSARDRDAEANSLAATQLIYECRGRIAALDVERELIRALLSPTLGGSDAR